MYCMAGNFGGKIFWWIDEIMTFGKVFTIMIVVAKWLIERAENLTGPWASFARLYQSDTETESKLPIFLGKWPQRNQHPSLQWLHTRHLDCLPRINKTTLPFWCPKFFGDVMSPCASADGELHAYYYAGASSCRPIVHAEAMIMQ